MACVNLAGMLLARASTRRREIAVRIAIGANRIRLVRQLITETVVLFAAGCALGLVLTQWLTRLLLAVLPTLPVPIGVDITVDWRVVSFAVGVSFVCSILCALAPALQASKPDLVPALKVDSAGRVGRLRLRGAFIVAQVTDLARARDCRRPVHPGARPRRQHRSGLRPDECRCRSAWTCRSAATRNRTRLAFADRLRARVLAMPGVQAAAFAAELPLDGGRMGLGSLRVPGMQPPGGTDLVPCGLECRLTRLLQDAEHAPRQRARLHGSGRRRRAWRDHHQRGDGAQRVAHDRRAGPPVRKRRDRQRSTTLTVVGVAPDAQVDTLGAEVRPFVYVPVAQRYMSRVSLLVKSSHGGIIPAVRTLLREMDPNLPVTTAMPLEQVTALILIPQRVAGAVAGSPGSRGAAAGGDRDLRGHVVLGGSRGRGKSGSAWRSARTAQASCVW